MTALELIEYIDRALIERPRGDSIWLDEQGKVHTADIGYAGEWWDECMKPELLRVLYSEQAEREHTNMGEGAAL